MGLPRLILKIRLYDIDRIVSRTVAYAVVTDLLLGVYTGLVLLATQLLKFHNTVAAATSVAAAPFNPVRHRCSEPSTAGSTGPGTTRTGWWPRSRAACRTTVDLGTVCADLRGVVEGALEPAHLSTWITPVD